MKARLTCWLASAAMLSLLAADSAWGLASGPRYSSRSYQHRASPGYSGRPPRPLAVTSNARVAIHSRQAAAFLRGATITPPPSLGKNRYYRPGPGYAPSRGINSADFKIKGL